MKLLTHNLLTSRFIKEVKSGYPLKLCVEQMEIVATDFNKDLVVTTMKKIDYPVLQEAALACGLALPDPVANDDYSDDQLKVIHNALFNTEVITGSLVCPETGIKFPISDGIPNMLVEP